MMEKSPMVHYLLSIKWQTLFRCFVLLCSPMNLVPPAGSCSGHRMALNDPVSTVSSWSRTISLCPPWSFLTLIVLRTGQRFCRILLWLIMSDISSQLDSSYKWIVFSELHNLTVVLCCPVMPVYFNLSSLKFLQIHTLSCYVPPMTHFIFF